MTFLIFSETPIDSLLLRLTVLCLTIAVVFIVKLRPSSRRSPDMTTSRSQPQLPPILKTTDRVFGLDFLLRNMRMVQQGRIMQEVVLDHRRYGSTFRVFSQLTNMLYTIDPANLKAIYETHLQDWGAEPHRLKALGPLCGAGHVTADGEELLRSDTVLRPFLQSDLVTTTLCRLASRMNTLLDRIPAHGQTFDIAPLIDSLASVDLSP